MLLMATGAAGTGRALRGFELKLQQLPGWALTAELTYLQRLALSLRSSSLAGPPQPA